MPRTHALRGQSYALVGYTLYSILSVLEVVYGHIVSNPSLPSSPTSQGDRSSSVPEADSPVSGLVTRRAPARGPTRRPETRRGFELEVDEDTLLTCGEIIGFRESLIASTDPRAQVPLRLAILATTIQLDEWLDEWSEDVEQVRRSITIRRRLDEKTVTVIATLASHGFGVDPSLSIESVAPPRGAAPKFHRSGVYRTIDLAASQSRAEVDIDIDIDVEVGGDVSVEVSALPEPTVG